MKIIFSGHDETTHRMEKLLDFSRTTVSNCYAAFSAQLRKLKRSISSKFCPEQEDDELSIHPLGKDIPMPRRTSHVFAIIGRDKKLANDVMLEDRSAEDRAELMEHVFSMMPHDQAESILDRLKRWFENSPSPEAPVPSFLQYVKASSQEKKVKILNNLHRMIDNILNNKPKKWKKQAMLYIHAAQKHDLLEERISIKDIKKEFHIDKTAYSSYRYKSSLDNPDTQDNNIYTSDDIKNVYERLTLNLDS